MSSSIELVALDVDGTLLTSDHRISRATQAALQRVHDGGVTVLPVTSRGAVAMRSVMSLAVPLRSQTFVAAQGALVGSYDADERLRIIERHPAALEPSRELVRLASAHGMTAHWFTGHDWFVSALDDSVREEARAVGADPVVEDLDALDAAPEKLMLIAPPRNPGLLDRVRARLPDGLQASVSHPGFLEITRSGVDKGWAVARYCRARGIAAAQVLAIGDGPNDLPLFAFAGTAVAPANARSEVRSAATMVTSDNDHDGVAEALDAFIA